MRGIIINIYNKKKFNFIIDISNVEVAQCREIIKSMNIRIMDIIISLLKFSMLYTIFR